MKLYSLFLFIFVSCFLRNEISIAETCERRAKYIQLETHIKFEENNELSMFLWKKRRK